MGKKKIVTFGGYPMTLVGNEVKVGDEAPAFTVLDKDLNAVHLADFFGKVKIISATPSLDTAVGGIQARKFNEEAGVLGDKVSVIKITMDLPFAIARFCASAGIEKIRIYSDHRDASFGNAYGILIKELRLLSRAIFVVDQLDIIRYIEVVPDIINQLNYDKVLTEAKNMIEL
jgi:thiol peroxidase